jgi:hypothetical protein
MDISTVNTNELSYYINYIIGLGVGYILIVLFKSFMTNRSSKADIDLTLDYYGKTEGKQAIHDVLTAEQSSLRMKFLIASTLIKAGTWIKVAYLFALYNRIHLFSRAEIGELSALTQLSSLIVGPIFGSLSDMYGRKKFCLLYCALVIAHTILRITGSRLLAIFANIITGFTGALVEIAFESWINFEATMLFSPSKAGNMQKNAYLREVFTK